MCCALFIFLSFIVSCYFCYFWFVICYLLLVIFYLLFEGAKIQKMLTSVLSESAKGWEWGIARCTWGVAHCTRDVGWPTWHQKAIKWSQRPNIDQKGAERGPKNIEKTMPEKRSAPRTVRAEAAEIFRGIFAEKVTPGSILEVILVPFSIKNAIKNKSRNRYRKKHEKTWANHENINKTWKQTWKNERDGKLTFSHKAHFVNQSLSWGQYPKWVPLRLTVMR